MIVYVVMGLNQDLTAGWPQAVYSTLKAAMKQPYGDIVPFKVDSPEWTATLQERALATAAEENQ